MWQKGSISFFIQKLVELFAFTPQLTVTYFYIN